MCTQREILQNDLLRSAKLGPWQKEKQQLKMGVLFYFSVFSVVFSLRSFFFSTGQIRVLSIKTGTAKNDCKTRDCKTRLQDCRLPQKKSQNPSPDLVVCSNFSEVDRLVTGDLVRILFHNLERASSLSLFSAFAARVEEF